MRQAILSRLKEGQSIEELIDDLASHGVGSNTIQASIDNRAWPYLGHTVAAWADGPPSSNVVAFIAGQSPGKSLWRRFTVTHTGTWRCEIDVFPTPFNNAEAPLAPGIPPGASRQAGAV